MIAKISFEDHRANRDGKHHRAASGPAAVPAPNPGSGNSPRDTGPFSRDWLSTVDSQDRSGEGRPGGRVATCPGRVGVRLPSASVMAPAESGVSGQERGPGAGSAEGATGTGRAGRRAG